jgi:hypothetical protein
VTALLLAGGCACAWAQAAAQSAGSIYTCVDAKGRRLTSDRPIPECLDRPQKELSPTGTVRRTLGPSLTAQERALEDERQRRLQEEQVRADEEKRRNKALLARYPNQAAHDRERALAQDQVDDIIAAASRRSVELEAQRKALMAEAEFFKDNPARMPAKLKKQIEENQQHAAAQVRFVADQREEKKRIDRRFDDELARLRGMWGQQAGLPVPATR